MEYLSKFKTAVACQILLALIGTTLLARDGALTPKVVGRIRSEFKMDSHTKSMYNAITNNDITALALNRDILREHNEVFSNKVKAKGITNQKKSGRCWLFAGLNGYAAEGDREIQAQGLRAFPEPPCLLGQAGKSQRLSGAGYQAERP